jgi:phthiocerol/phenolphthiocerol synthesis type-I polyketide synthase D
MRKASTSIEACVGGDGYTGIDLLNLVTVKVAGRLGDMSVQINPDIPFAHYGMDSQNAIQLAYDLEESLEMTLSPTLLWEHPTIGALVRHLEAVMASARTNGAQS